MSSSKQGMRTSYASLSALPADVFRSLHEDTAYLYNFMHFTTLLSTSKTIQLYAS